MESLLANYASEEEEEEERESSTSSKPTSKPLSLPPPKPSKTSSILSSLPPPKSSFFSSLPPPKPHPPKPANSTSTDPTPKRVVQFKPPLNPLLLKSQHPDIEDDEEQAKPTKEIPYQIQNTSSKSLFSILPPPRNSLGVAPPRRSAVEATTPAAAVDAPRLGSGSGTFENMGNYESSSAAVGLGTGNGNGGNYVNYGNFEGNSVDGSLGEGGGNYGNYDNYGNFQPSSVVGSAGVSNEDYGNYGSHEGNLVDRSLGASNENYESYEGNWADGSTVVMGSGPSGTVESVGRMMGKRGRNEIPSNIVEVKQDELISNRPREDQVKLTGIAFGPAYQPVSSSKGKPSKLHKRKHQIGSLFFDMKQKEMELAERRAKGFLTKAETQAKYGW
ncbi:5'-3' exoribonuclease 2 isoform X2 [Magnolia sinica]|uniref:5'-3' exoribonuclease 2 isoform X2 n=1 Tax=Magnolia sinica TaxID=86752 RepID=UPI00265A5F37|nr:5'-3' exoribonuclease 2 isoform X2 [Magnolia sinica]